MDPMVSWFDSSNNEECGNTMPSSLPPEAEEGNVEYKLKLVNPAKLRFEHLVTQMKWRLREGQGEAIYEIGVEDNGLLTGLSEFEMDASLVTLHRMAEKLGATITVLRECTIESDKGDVRKAAEVLVRKVPDDQQFIDLRVAVVGNVDAGKSTLLGVLTHGELDNGRGRARLNLFRHLHEIQSGRTSSISHEVLGFDSNGMVVNYSTSRTAEETMEKSSKLITFTDLAGHHKYLKTTISGLTGYDPDFAMLVVSANTGIVGTTKEHLGLTMALDVPIFVVVNKVDICPPHIVERTLTQLERILKAPGCKKVPLRVCNEDDAITAASNFSSESITPLFTISSVTGYNLDLLTKFLNVLPPFYSSREKEAFMQQFTEFQIDETFRIPDVGVVVGGFLSRGVIEEGEELLIGPTFEGQFLPTVIHTLHRNKAPCRVVRAGQGASLALADFDKLSIRKGMVLVSPLVNPMSCIYFEASIYVLFHAKAICRGFQTTIHIGNVRQTAIIEEMDRESVQTNQKAVVKFRFIKQPEYLRIGSQLLFRESTTKGIGRVLRVISLEESPPR